MCLRSWSHRETAPRFFTPGSRSESGWSEKIPALVARSLSFTVRLPALLASLGFSVDTLEETCEYIPDTKCVDWQRED